MRSRFGFVLGLVLGLGVATAGSSVIPPEQQAMPMATCVGQGYAFGWVVTLGGEEVCSEPFLWSATKEIECE